MVPMTRSTSGEQYKCISFRFSLVLLPFWEALLYLRLQYNASPLPRTLPFSRMICYRHGKVKSIENSRGLCVRMMDRLRNDIHTFSYVELSVSAKEGRE